MVAKAFHFAIVSGYSDCRVFGSTFDLSRKELFMKTLRCSLLIVILLISGCSKKEIIGTDRVTSESRSLSAFSTLNVQGLYTVSITIGSSQSVSITTNGNLQPFIQTTVSGKTLTVQTKKGYTLKPQGIPSIDIVTPELSRIDASGNNRLLVKNLASGNLKLNLSGTNAFTGQGSIKTFTLKTSGNSIVDAQHLLAKEVDINSSGNAKMLVNAKENLDVSISGAATITYFGNPSVSKQINGSGAVTPAQEIINK